jgi:hypothetical protein
LDADAPQHASSRALLEAGHAASVILYVTSQIICEFYSVVTNPRRVAKPCSPVAALAAISSLLGFLRVLPVPAHTVEELIRLVRRRPVTGGDIFDRFGGVVPAVNWAPTPCLRAVIEDRRSCARCRRRLATRKGIGASESRVSTTEHDSAAALGRSLCREGLG